MRLVGYLVDLITMAVVMLQAIQERHENSLLKTEMDKLREENKTMRETINKACCPNCGTATTSRGTALTTEEQQLRIENAKLKAEVIS
jgi:homeobox-leucine zipper protein